ncbi:MAG TPA: NTP transferase domain-containing protein [Segetibacter sp.]
MTLEEADGMNHKHANLIKPISGEFGRNEMAILGTNCSNIRNLAYTIIDRLSAKINIAYVDADHKSGAETIANTTALSKGASLEYTDKIDFARIDYNKQPNKFERQSLFNQQGLILVNGNHFTAKAQILVIDSAKPVEKKLDKLTSVQLIILLGDETIPAYLGEHLDQQNIPVCTIDDLDTIVGFIQSFLQKAAPPLKALVLSGGKSTRMKTDKGSLAYHGVSQRKYLFDMMSRYCKTFVSCNHQQAVELAEDFTKLEDTFLNLGPIGGILSALQSDPNAAWLTVACDLPYLSENTIQYLINHRNPAKTATAFLDPNGEFPEPLITIWEPESYLVLLQFLAQGYSCPRKVLINADVEILQAPDVAEFENVNLPEQSRQAMQHINADNID